MTGILLIKICGIILCIYHIYITKGKFFKLNTCLLSFVIFLLQAIFLYYVFGDIPRAQYWDWRSSVFNDSIASPMTAWHFERGGWFSIAYLIAFSLVINFPHFYFFLILFSGKKGLISNFSVLYALWCLLIWFFGNYIDDHQVITRKEHLQMYRYNRFYCRKIAEDEIRKLDQAVRAFWLDTGKLPTQNQGLSVLLNNDCKIENWKGPYIQTIPLDPWKHHYIYRIPGQYNEFEIISLGADGKPGGENEFADIGI